MKRIGMIVLTALFAFTSPVLASSNVQKHTHHRHHHRHHASSAQKLATHAKAHARHAHAEAIR